jgi:para-nitrobenzyl esterase
MTIGVALHAALGEVHAQPVSCLVTTTIGEVLGLDRGNSCAFLGIPYAAPPIGPLRWKPPQAAAPWLDVFNATTTPATCALLNATGVPAGSEDCLKLNVWTPDPKPATPAPVIVWLHTGSFVAASANQGAHNGQNLAEQTGTIVVVPNYRLGPFGFLAHPALTAEDPSYPSSGNYGLLDQRAALAWVRANIAAFGGDPSRVTVAGTSAGAHSVSMHVTSPGSAGLFHRAVMQSGFGTIRWPTRDEAEQQGERFAAALGCNDPLGVASCMRLATRQQVLQALTLGTFEFRERPTHWTPNVDGVELPDQPRLLYSSGDFARVPLLLGVTRDEGWTFVTRSFSADMPSTEYDSAIDIEFADNAAAVLGHYPSGVTSSPRDELAQLTGDAEYTCEATRLARAVEQTGTPVYLYSFEYEVDAIALDRVIHGLETNFVFGNNFGPPLIAGLALTDQDKVLARVMGGYWSRFAATGNPNTDDPAVVHWPAFKHPTGAGRGADKYLILSGTVREAQRLHEDACAFWWPYFFRSLIGPVPAAP